MVTRSGVDVYLSPTEYKLLRYLLVNVGRVVSKSQILNHVWDYDFEDLPRCGSVLAGGNARGSGQCLFGAVRRGTA